MIQLKFILFAVIILLPNAIVNSQNLNPGDKLIPFTAVADDGSAWKSVDYVGKNNLVIYFYPAAMTGGCTKQACAYRDSRDDLTMLDAIVVGISGDAVENLAIFKKANDLNFPLLSDPDGKIAEMFGVPVTKEIRSIEREVDGKLYTLTRELTTKRWTFVFNKNGELVHKSTEVNASEDSKEVITILKKLN